jgi:hypothetical protein
MKSLATLALVLTATASPAQAKTGLEALDSISDFFTAAGNNSAWLVIAAIAFVIYIAGSAHRA